MPLVGYSDLDARLDNIYDAVVAVSDILVAVNSKRKSTGTSNNRALRPLTAYQRLKRQQKIQQLDAIVERMTGGR